MVVGSQLAGGEPGLGNDAVGHVVAKVAGAAMAEDGVAVAVAAGEQDGVAAGVAEVCECRGGMTLEG